MIERKKYLDALIKKKDNGLVKVITGIDGSNEFITAFKKYKNITELTRPMLLHLVKQIKVFENNTIEIVFNYADPFKEAVEYIRMNQQNLEAAS